MTQSPPLFADALRTRVGQVQTSLAARNAAKSGVDVSEAAVTLAQENLVDAKAGFKNAASGLEAQNSEVKENLASLIEFLQGFADTI